MKNQLARAAKHFVRANARALHKRSLRSQSTSRVDAGTFTRAIFKASRRANPSKDMIGILDIASPPVDEPRMRVAPMLDVRGLCAILDRNFDQVIKLISSGKLGWAFDIGLSQKCAEIRVLPAAVILYCAGVPSRLTWEEITASLIPEMATAKPGALVTITAREIQRLLNAGQSHVQELINCRQLKGLSESRSGPNGSPKVSAQSFLSFLQKRKMR